jgi:hypothetical protein
MTADALFPIDAQPTLTPDQKRTRRQAQAVAVGAQPLGLAFRRMLILRHPDTQGQTYTRDDPRGRPLTCGTCEHRQPLPYQGRSWPKCFARGGRRVTRGPGTDVRAWWPACTLYQPKEEGL